MQDMRGPFRGPGDALESLSSKKLLIRVSKSDSSLGSLLERS